MLNIYKKNSIYLLLLLSLGSCSVIEQQSISVIKGNADLSGLDKQSITILDGEWEFYPDVFLNPVDIDHGAETKATYAVVPDAWDNYPSGLGYGTYRLTLDGLNPYVNYSLYFYEKVSAARYYVNGVFLGSDGIPGHTQNEERPEYVPSLQSFSTATGRAELVIHISNYHFKNGGFWESVHIGESSVLQQFWARKILIQSLIIGALFFMALYHFFLYLLNPKNKTTLWLSLVIILGIIKSLISGEHILMHLIPNSPQIAFIKLSTLSVTFMVPFFQSFFRRSFPDDIHPFVIKVNYSISFFYGLLIISLNLVLVQRVYFAYLWIILINLGYLAYISVRSFYYHRTGAMWSFLGTLILLGTGLNDILYELHYIQTSYILNFGVLTFLVFQTLLNASRNSSAYKELELLRTLLEKKVELRTQELQEERNKLEKIARIDHLTGLNNRNSSLEIFNKEIQRYQRYGTGFSIVLLDLDHFKKVNDTHGHTVGDTTLQIVAKEILRISRSSDFCFRWGGEEFLLLLPNTSEDNAFSYAEKLRQNVESVPISAGNNTFYVTLSFGISCVKDKNEDLIQILNRADTALYRAKDDGRNRGYVYK